MALIISGKSVCPLCKKVMRECEGLIAFPAFLPHSHKFGKFSDAAFHKMCFEADPDASSVNDMHYVYQKIMDSRPKDLKTMKEIDEWTKEAFQDWPPPNGVVVFTSLDGDDWFWSDKDAWGEFERAEEKANKEAEERLEEELKREREAYRFSRDD